MIKLKLIDHICSPQLDCSITTAILNYGQCKNFGATHLNALLEPIVRQHPFKLVIADYLAMLKSKRGFYQHSLDHRYILTVHLGIQAFYMKHYVTPVYAPWVNGLVEGSNKL